MREDAPTEIYLPWVHYASERKFTPASSSSKTLADGRLDMTEKKAARLAASTGFLSGGSSQTSVQLPPFELDVEVHLSEGRYELDGQVLRWWYNTDSAGAGGGGKRTAMISVKRKDGPLRMVGRPEVGTVELSAWNVCAWL